MSTPLHLRDDPSGATASISPEQGFNCFQFQAMLGGRPVEVLWSHPDFLAGTQKPSRSGVPILFPFAGRIRGTQFSFQGKSYPLDVGDDFGNAIHGFVLNRPWRVTEHTTTMARGEFQASRDAVDVLASWPADFRIDVTYRLQGNALKMDTLVENPDQRPLPFWFGTHPYFRVPLVPGSDPAKCRVWVPADRQWQLDAMLPSGRVLPVGPHCDLQGGPAFTALRVDDILTGLRCDGGRCSCRIDDTQAGHSLEIAFGQEFTECVVFVPPHREAICIEPYTSVSNAFELEGAGVHTGLRVLAPGESFRATITIQVR
jgi:aldose 1-epimerase